MNMKYITITILLLSTCMIAMPAGAMINPSAGYCMELGYQYLDTVGTDGSMTGYCMLPGNQSVDAWKFLQGTAAPDMSYCKKQGLEVRTVNDPDVCGMLGSPCAVCVKADGSTQEVTNMMGLDFREKICNDKICCDPATDNTCAIGADQVQEPSPGVTTTAKSPGFAVITAIAAVFCLALVRKRSR